MARKKSKSRRRKLSGAAKAAFLRRMAAGRRKAAGGSSAARTPRRRRRSTSSGAVLIMASKKRRRRRHSAARNPRRRHRVRRNPPAFSVKGIAGAAIQGGKDALAITAGQAATNFVARMVPISSTVPALGVRVAVAIAAGVAASQFLGRDVGRLVLAGGLTVPLQSALKAANVPLLTGALSSDEEITRFYRNIGAYPARARAAAPARLGAYPPAPSSGRVPGGGVGDLTLPQLNAALTGGNAYY
jgi:hypothetical protein